ncbi:unnamed protein product [Protopolystoma xenopodis]|uniref:Uncharacterized protein n=1 Tax=Protopolystoma xenopodis TaxID=117903 RepID=A0A3S5ASN7_9PLAT|nr:unnamed protein product [Protopolystoma xenopodis]
MYILSLVQFRSVLQENIDLLRIQRELRDRQSEVATISARLAEAQTSLDVAQTANRQLIAEVDRAHRESRQREARIDQLEAETETGSNRLRLRLVEVSAMLFWSSSIKVATISIRE